jgi:hypothetical protein
MLSCAVIVPSAGSMPHVHIPVRFRSHPILMSVVNGPEATVIPAPVGPGFWGRREGGARLHVLPALAELCGYTPRAEPAPALPQSC